MHYAIQRTYKGVVYKLHHPGKPFFTEEESRQIKMEMEKKHFTVRTFWTINGTIIYISTTKKSPEAARKKRTVTVKRNYSLLPKSVQKRLHKQKKIKAINGTVDINFTTELIPERKKSAKVNLKELNYYN